MLNGEGAVVPVDHHQVNHLPAWVGQVSITFGGICHSFLDELSLLYYSVQLNDHLHQTSCHRTKNQLCNLGPILL
jgi:hypothetical protein